MIKNLCVKFVIFCKETKSGENLYVSGNTPSLGNWDINKAIKLSTNQFKFPTWESDEISLIFDKSENKFTEDGLEETSLSKSNSKVIFEYKYFIKREKMGAVNWESFSGNRLFTTDMIHNIADKLGKSEQTAHEYFLINGEIFNDKNTLPKIIKITNLKTYNEKEAIKIKDMIMDANKIKIQPQVKYHKHSENSNLGSDGGLLKNDSHISKPVSNGKTESETQPETLEDKSTIEDDKEEEACSSTTEENFTIDSFLNDLEIVIEDIKNDKGKLKSNLQLLFDTFKEDRNIDKELILLIFIHFVKSGQLKFPDRLVSYYEHRHHHDPTLARTMYTYLLSIMSCENSMLVKSILFYVPTCLEYRVKEYVDEPIKKEGRCKIGVNSQ